MRSRDLRRLQLGWASYFLIDGISMVGLSVWAFRRCRHLGGRASRFGAAAARRDRAAVRCVGRRSLLATARGVRRVPRDHRRRRRRPQLPWLPTRRRSSIYLLIAFNSVAGTPYRPAHLALAPLVARSPAELVAMNVTAGTLEGLVTFVGPALAALLLLGVDPWFVVAVVVARRARRAARRSPASTSTVDPSKAVRRSHDRPRDALMGGLMELRANIDMAILVGCFVAQIFVRGILGVLLVSVSFDLIDLGSSGVGWLAAAMGIGGIVGAMYAVTLTGQRRLGKPFALALVPLGIPHRRDRSAAPHRRRGRRAARHRRRQRPARRLRLHADPTARHRSLPRSRVRCALHVRHRDGWPRLARCAAADLVARPATGVDRRRVDPAACSHSSCCPGSGRSTNGPSPFPKLLSLLTSIPLLSPLPPITLEKLAARSAMVDMAAGDVVVAEGDPGDLFYVIADGEVEVSRGRATRTARSGPASSSGRSRCSATPAARRRSSPPCPTRLVTIDGRDFVDAVSSSEAAFSIGRRVADELLSRNETNGPQA